MVKPLLAAVLAIAALLGAPLAGRAAETEKLDHVEIHVNDLVSLQSGARTFVNYCLNCHSASLVRYNALRQIGLTEEQIQDNLLFTAEKVGMPMSIAMKPKDAKEWFGTVPPDLSVIARARGTDWLYTYLRGFYRDPTTTTGWNNLVYRDVAMPHVLWKLQGERVLEEREAVREGKPILGEDGRPRKIVTLQMLRPGTQSTSEYDKTIYDLVSFLAWMAEPHQLARKQLGVWVLFGVAVLIFVTYLLKQAYWKDVH